MTNLFKERPILMSDDMARATWEFIKTQTRRTKGLEAVNQNPEEWDKQGFMHDSGDFPCFFQNIYGEGLFVNCPYGIVGDRLWVREAWAKITCIEHDIVTCDNQLFYRADSPQIISKFTGKQCHPVWKPSIHMPRWASRMLLEITDIRVERVQDISEEDAKAEGVTDWIPTGVGPKKKYSDSSMQVTHIEAFEYLWNSINEKLGLGWNFNPWVWAITFRRLE